jgi:hypothetical protein
MINVPQKILSQCDTALQHGLLTDLENGIIILEIPKEITVLPMKKFLAVINILSDLLLGLILGRSLNPLGR